MKIGLTLNLTVVLEEKEIIHTVSLVPAHGLTFLSHYTCQLVVRLELEGGGAQRHTINQKMSCLISHS